MHKHGNLAPKLDIEHTAEAKTRETQRQVKRQKPGDIHPSLRALPDYPE